MQTQPPTFEQLPNYVYELGRKVDQLLDRLNQPATSPPPDELLTVKQAAILLDLTIATVYGMVYEKRIPFSKPGGRLYFSRVELLEWARSGRKATTQELDEQARQQVATRIDRRKQSKERKGGRTA